MGKEIERKFLVKKGAWQPKGKGDLYRQGYLSTVKERVVRVRVTGDKGFLTVKGMTEGFSRLEFEYEIPVRDARQMLDTLCERPLIEKHRYRVEHEGMIWEIDIFLGDNEGLVLAEVELEGATQQFALPGWIGEEVSEDPRYFNANLVKNPFRQWHNR
jgi:CYTH domain-containing protein